MTPSRSFQSPVRVPMPRLSCRKRGAATPMETPDRFIPKRTRMDFSKTPLVATTQNNNNNKRKSHYDEQLRTVLFGNDDNKLMEFHDIPAPKKKLKFEPTRLFQENHDPYRHDVLRALDTNTANKYNNKRRHPKWTRVTMECYRVLDAPMMNTCSDLLHLFGAGKDCMAVALDNRVYFWKHGKITLLAELDSEHDQLWTCLQWSQDGTLLALGTMGAILVYDQDEREVARVYADDPSSECTAMAWKGRDELVAAFTEGPLQRYKLEEANHLLKETSSYDQGSFHNDQEEDTVVITAVQWSGNVIATAGGGRICLYDSRRAKPRRVLEHEGVVCLEFCPKQPNLLISGGKDGLKFWNTWNGKLRGQIDMPERNISAIIGSMHRSEVLVGHGTSLSLWSLESGQQLYERPCGSSIETAGKVLGMKRGLDPGTILCADDKERLSMYSFRREVSKETARAAAGTLVMPTLR